MKTKLLSLLCTLLLMQVTNAQIFNGYFMANGDTVQSYSEFFLCKDSCYTFSIVVSGGTSPYTYAWSNGSATDSTVFCYSDLQPYNDDTLMVIVTDQNSLQEYFFIRAQNYPDVIQNICLVTVDSVTGKNIIIWEQNPDPDVFSYNIFKETTTLNQYQIIGSVLKDSLSVFIDANSNPAQVSARYTMTVNHTCALSTPGPVHKTMHLTINQGMNNTWNLIWENYQGDNYPVKNRIWRGSTALGLQLIDSLSSSSTTYTDLNPPAGVLYYAVEMIPQHACNPSLKNTFYTSSFSNTVDNINLIGINEIQTSPIISLIPNPAAEKFSIITENSINIDAVEIFNICGEKINFMSLNNNHIIDLSTQSRGIYFVSVTIGNNVYRKKIVKQ